MTANHRSENSPNRSPIPRNMNVKQVHNFFYDGIFVLRSVCTEGFVPDSPDSIVSVQGTANPDLTLYGYGRIRKIGYESLHTAGSKHRNTIIKKFWDCLTFIFLGLSDLFGLFSNLWFAAITYIFSSHICQPFLTVYDCHKCLWTSFICSHLWLKGTHCFC